MLPEPFCRDYQSRTGNLPRAWAAIPFEAARISSLYPSAKDRTRKVNDSVDRAVKARYFIETDGKKMKAALAKDAGK
jgi:Alpha/beta hydrolase domain